MSKIITQCPSCENPKVHAVKMTCADCKTSFEGQFDIPVLLKLSEEDLDFILNFVKCSGSLKEMANQQGISYPTLRNRLNDLIEKIGNLQIIQHQGSKSEVLDLLEQGKISAQQAAKILYKL